MAEAKIVTLHNENGEAVAPRTAATAVSTASGESVEAVLARISTSFLRVVSFDATTGTLTTEQGWSK